MIKAKYLSYIYVIIVLASAFSLYIMVFSGAQVVNVAAVGHDVIAISKQVKKNEAQIIDLDKRLESVNRLHEEVKRLNLAAATCQEALDECQKQQGKIAKAQKK